MWPLTRCVSSLVPGYRSSLAASKITKAIDIHLAWLATPLVVSVHSIVSFDFAVALLPGWHSTIFPPYFVAGAIFSGFAMVLTIAIPVRAIYHLEEFITMRHLRNMALVLLTTGMIVGYGYLMETFTAWYSGNEYEIFTLYNRMFGPYAPLYWAMLGCNVLEPQVLWFRRARASVPLLFVVALLVNIGMWLERFTIVVTSLHRDFLPSSWGMYYPTVWDWATFVGTIGLFVALLFLFLRFLPMISIFEMRELVAETEIREET
jgi:Ni/Fe-hydrogenase subunit HybB-like protein